MIVPTCRILIGDVLVRLRELPDESVNCVVTSPPYWGLRDYGVAGQIGLEDSPQEFIRKLVVVFREVRRVLRRDGTCWVNMGDCYTDGGRGSDDHSTLEGSRNNQAECRKVDVRTKFTGLKRKDLVGQPWRLAFALQDDGWWLRQDIIWSKPNPMPESVRDRCTKSHEYIFLLTKSRRYYYDAEAILEDCSPNSHPRLAQDVVQQIGSERAHGGTKANGNMKAVARGVNPKAKRVAGWAYGPGDHSVLDHSSPANPDRKTHGKN